MIESYHLFVSGVTLTVGEILFCFETANTMPPIVTELPLPTDIRTLRELDDWDRDNFWSSYHDSEDIPFTS